MSFQAYLDSIKAKTGKTPEDFIALADQRGLLAPGVKATEIVNWLKSDYGLGYGHAMAIVNVFKHHTGPNVTTDERIGKLFSGPRGVWRSAYDVLVGKLQKFGPDVRLAATDSYISLLRSNKKFGIVQVTVERMDLGIKLKSLEVGGRVESAGRWNAMVTHRVRVTEPAELDDELINWLKQAYDQAA